MWESKAGEYKELGVALHRSPKFVLTWGGIRFPIIFAIEICSWRSSVRKTTMCDEVMISNTTLDHSF